ncbi:MAG: PocR ligand-binding domain-containing protein [Deltaproteobacteria bacterium]|nr:MAG: PocR ligand-binding domain-containing protein [Deltaproteobacteria bacterium]
MPGKIHLLDLINARKLDQILKDFTAVTGVASIIADPYGRPITEPHNFTDLCQKYCRSTREGRRKCYQSDRFGGVESARSETPPIYTCLNAGLLDCAAPVVVEDSHLATVLCGQVLDEPVDSDVAVERARAIGIRNIDAYLQELAKVPLMTRQRLLDIANLMSVITKTISELALGKFLLHKHSQDYLNRLINSISDCIISTSADGIISMINQSGAAMFGAEKTELIGQSICRLFSGPTSKETSFEQVGRKLKHSWRGELIAVRADEKPFPVQVSVSGINAENSTGSDSVAVIRDISEEKRIERMKEDLIGMVTHDMRNPVLSIQKAMQLLVDETLGPLNESQLDVMQLTLGTSHQLYGMANDLLDIYRSENGQFFLIKSPIDLNQIINKGISQLEFFAKDKEASVFFEPASEPMRLYGDQKRLLRVCVNLLDNAIKYSPERGEIRISASLIGGSELNTLLRTAPEADVLQLRDGYPYILISVSDQGIGIPQEYHQLVFDKFFKIRSGDREGRKGVGLGLAFCKQVIEVHGGLIWVESPSEQDDSTNGRGCKFCFILPRGPIQ